MNTETLLKYIAGELSDSEREMVYSWICESENNRSEYESMRLLFDLNVWRENEAATMAAKPKTRKPVANQAWRWAFQTAIAACLTAAFIFAAAMVYRPEPVAPLASCESISAPAGKDIRVDLTDGTIVWLNSSSTLHMITDSDEATRRVRLEGEGYFKVAKDSKHPFIVETDRFDVKVLGTEFDITAYPGMEWSTALLTGAVEIDTKSGEKITVLNPMTKASFREGSMVLSPIDSDSYLWKDGIIYFDNLPLSTIFEKLSLYYDLRVDVSNAKNLDHRYTGKFRTSDGYEHIFKVLQMDSNFKYTITPTPEAVTIKIR